MARQRRHDQHPRLRGVDVLGEVQQLAEGQVERDLLGHRHVAVADPDRGDAEARPGMRELEAREQLERGRAIVAPRQGQRAREASSGPSRRAAQRREKSSCSWYVS